VWSVQLQNYEKLILLSILRRDRVPAQIKCLAEEVLGKENSDYIEKSLIDLKQIYKETNCTTPILFLLDENGTPEPLNSVSALCSSIKPTPKFYSLTISKENAHLANKLFEEGVQEGHWIYFSNCHAAHNYMTELENRLEELKKYECEKQKQKAIHPFFRLWLCTMVDPKKQLLPIEILRHSIKIAIEQPQVNIK